MQRDSNLPSYTELNPLKAMRPHLGRDASVCQIVLADTAGSISKFHCLAGFDSASRQLCLEDNYSSNGTYLGAGERLVPGRRSRLSTTATFYLSRPAVMFQVVAE